MKSNWLFAIYFMFMASAAQAEIYLKPCPSDYVDETISLVNYIRERSGVPRVEKNPSLMRSALSRAAELAQRNRLNHDGWKESIIRAGYSNYTSIAENLARGYPSPLSVVNGWFKSEGHRENMLEPQFNYVGIGCVKAPDGSLWWSQHFAAQN